MKSDFLTWLIPINFICMVVYTVPLVYANIFSLPIVICFIWLDLSKYYHVWCKANEKKEEDVKLLERFSISSKVESVLYILVEAYLFFSKYHQIDKVQHTCFIFLSLIKLVFHMYENAVDSMKLEKKKGFENYEDLSSRVRMMVIDQMEPKTRFRFSECSTLSNKEAKQSNDYIHGLQILTYESHARIEVTHLSTGSNAEGYVLKFSEEGHKKYVECSKMEKSERRYSVAEKLWKSELDGSSDVDQHAVQYFKRLLGMYQNKIKKLSVNTATDSSNNVDFEIESLDNLEELWMYGGDDIQHLLAKIRKPLKVLSVGEKDGGNLENFEKIYHVQQLSSYGTKLNNAQFSRLAASDVSINIGSLTENDIYNFIRSWQDGTIGKKVKHFSWDLTDSTFNVGTVLQLLGVEMNGDPIERYEIEHHKKAGTRAILRCYEFKDSCVFSFEPVDEA